MTAELGSGIDIFLHPGEWYFGDRHCRIKTTLGSCVALTLWHPERKIGGMCHYLLPGATSPDLALNARYAQDAIEVLITEMRSQGTNPVDCQAKLFGGADMMASKGLSTPLAYASIGQRNIQAAEALVKRHGLLIAARDMGGSVHRQVCFDLATGDVWIRRGRREFGSSLVSNGI